MNLSLLSHGPVLVLKIGKGLTKKEFFCGTEDERTFNLLKEINFTGNIENQHLNSQEIMNTRDDEQDILET